jgi:hypothetical protein
VHRPETGQTAGLAAVVGAGCRLHRIKTPVERRRRPRGRGTAGAAGGRAPGQVRRTTTVPSPAAGHTPCASGVTPIVGATPAGGRDDGVRENV